MKIVFLISMFFTTYTVNAQITPKADSAFYLLDTTKTLASDKLWHTYREGLVKFYELKIYASCSELMDKPTFAYSSHFQQPAKLSPDKLKLIKIFSLAELIYKLKQFAEEDKATKYDVKKPFYLYFIEPNSGGYTLVKTQLEGSGPKSITK
ncbi:MULTISPECIES: hypothetical protein [Mucilaginibacter]|uniref:hypothetical protein n=1 Tax=Mucilaginibacter TaxID=423349 RepID=UPI00159D85C1|nr:MULTISPECIES: hypothetical protein [Mucilaginibacter]NVM63758.1 hypothetical protein [Mucilaginibacter sp. SG538B]